jgi:hypothetical protein
MYVRGDSAPVNVRNLRYCHNVTVLLQNYSLVHICERVLICEYLGCEFLPISQEDRAVCRHPHVLSGASLDFGGAGPCHCL